MEAPLDASPLGWLHDGTRFKKLQQSGRVLIADAWIKGDIMSYIKYSDLPSKSVDERILLFQPRTTIPANVPIATESQGQPSEKYLKQVFDDAVNLTGLVHVCSLLCKSGFSEHAGPFAVGPRCGGNLVLQTRAARSGNKESTEIALTCDGDGCNMDVTYIMDKTKRGLSNLLLHLMLKQMVPNLASLNHVDCGLKKASYFDPEHRQEGEYINGLGLISIASEAVWGNVENGFFESPELSGSRFTFGFMMEKGMQTADGCGGHDKWLQLLVRKNLESLKEIHSLLTPFLCGPKPV